VAPNTSFVAVPSAILVCSMPRKLIFSICPIYFVCPVMFYEHQFGVPVLQWKTHWIMLPLKFWILAWHHFMPQRNNYNWWQINFIQLKLFSLPQTFNISARPKTCHCVDCMWSTDVTYAVLVATAACSDQHSFDEHCWERQTIEHQTLLTFLQNMHTETSLLFLPIRSTNV